MTLPLSVFVWSMGERSEIRGALPRECDVLPVVGAGIAGLAAAWHLRDLDVVVLESEQRVGGRIRSEPRGDYWLNLAAHVFAPPESNLEACS